jgi:hypothetical protein
MKIVCFPSGEEAAPRELGEPSPSDTSTGASRP